MSENERVAVEKDITPKKIITKRLTGETMEEMQKRHREATK